MRKRNSIAIVLVSVLIIAFLSVSCSASDSIANNGKISGSKYSALEPIVKKTADVSPEGQASAEAKKADSTDIVPVKVVSGVQETSSETAHLKAAEEDQIAGIENLQNSFNTVVKRVLPTVVEINVTAMEKRQNFNLQGWPWFFDTNPDEEYESNRLGSGVIFRKTGNTYYILTNNHVATGADSIDVVLDDSRSYEAVLVGADKRRDLAVISFESDENDIPIATLGDSDELAVGDWVLAMGSPFGYVSSVTAGIVSALGRSGRDINNINDFIQTDAAINSGNSGGPLVNIYGEVIGINTWIAAPSGGSIGLGFSIPISNAKLIIDELIQYGKAIDGWLGISMLDTDQYESLLKTKDSMDIKGVFVGNVYLDSPAYRGGIRAGDIITGFNGKQDITVEDLSRFISDSPLGVKQTFTVSRDGKQYHSYVTLETRKTNEDISKNSNKLWPGVLPIELNDKILTSLGLSHKQNGVMIQLMTTSSEQNRFQQAGLMNYDVITKINGKKIENLSDFYHIISDDTITEYEISYIREGKIYTAGVKK